MINENENEVKKVISFISKLTFFIIKKIDKQPIDKENKQTIIVLNQILLIILLKYFFIKITLKINISTRNSISHFQILKH